MRIISMFPILLLVAACQSASMDNSTLTEKEESPVNKYLMTPPNSEPRLTDCASTYNPETREFALCWAGEKLTFQESCAAANDGLSNQWSNDFQKAAIFEKAKNIGCYS